MCVGIGQILVVAVSRLLRQLLFNTYFDWLPGTRSEIHSEMGNISESVHFTNKQMFKLHSFLIDPLTTIIWAIQLYTYYVIYVKAYNPWKLKIAP